MSEEFYKLLEAFNTFNVIYLIVGGLAVNHYGYNRSTGDIDFWLKDTVENRGRLINALEHNGYGRMNELMETPFVPGFCEIYLDSGIYADILAEIHGYSQDEFDKCYSNSKSFLSNDVSIRFIGYSDLLESKKQSLRPKDQLDVIELTKINRP